MNDNSTPAHDGLHPPDTPATATPRRAMLAGMAGIAAGALLTRGAKAGPLNPPAGPVTSTGKTLTEVEPRIAVNQTNTPGDSAFVYRITQPGSYYLTGNVIGEPGKNGIAIGADNVTLDLNGFTVIGVPGALTGIRPLSGTVNNTSVRNGTVVDWPLSGLYLDAGSNGFNALVEGVTASNNGNFGISAANNAVLRGSIAENNGSVGFRVQTNSLITECCTRNNGGAGIQTVWGSAVINCSARDNGGFGISVSNSSIVQGCSSRGNGTSGIVTGNGCTIVNCSVTNNALHGIAGLVSGFARGNVCRDNGTGDSGAGIIVSGGNARIEDNHCVGNRIGIQTSGGVNFIARNTCRNNALSNFVISAGNVCFVLPAMTSGIITGNNGGVSPGSINPNANYAF